MNIKSTIYNYIMHGNVLSDRFNILSGNYSYRTLPSISDVEINFLDGTGSSNPILLSIHQSILHWSTTRLEVIPFM